VVGLMTEEEKEKAVSLPWESFLMFQLQSKEKEEVKKNGTQAYIHRKVEIFKKLRYCCFT